MPLERIQKILARAGIASRRKSEELIQEGEVTINGKLASLGDKAVFGKDAIKVRGKLLRGVESQVYLAFNKPKGVIAMVAEDQRNRPTLKTYLKAVKQRVFPVGRMDFNGEGLMLLTNDGDFSAELQKSKNVTRTYEVKVRGAPDQTRLDKLAAGARVEGKNIKPHAIRITHKLANKHVVEVIFIGMGTLNVKELFVEKGFLVERVLRTAIGHISIRGIPPGAHKLLKKSQVEALLHQPELGHRSHKPVI